MLLLLRVALVLAIVLFVPNLRDSFEPPKVAVLRVAGIALLIAAAGVRRGRRWDAIDLAALAWLATEALATLASRAPLVSLLGEPMQREGLVTSLALVGLYAATRSTHTSNPSRAIATLGWLIAASAIACLYALAQAAGLDPIHWVGSAVYAPGGALERPSGTFGHPNLMGVMSAATAVAALALALSASSRRALFAIAAVVAGAATIATLSRAAWLAIAIAGPIALLLSLRARRAPSRPLLIAGGAAVVILVVAALGMGWGPRLAARFTELLAPGTGAGASRIEIWRSAFHAWEARPWLGQGPDTFALVFHRFQTPAYWRFEWAGLPYHAHSIVLHALATRGVLGIAAAVAWFVLTATAAPRAWRADEQARPVVAALVASSLAVGIAGLFGAIGVVGAAWLVVASAMLASLASTERTPSEAPVPRVVVAVAAAAALALAFVGWSDLSSSASARAADQWLERARGDVDQGADGREARLAARAAADRAVRMSPLDDALHRLRAEALLAVAPIVAGDPLADAEREARTAVRLVPGRAENHEQLARVLAARALSGEIRAGADATAEIDRVIALAPMNALLLGECARLETLLGRPERARAITDRLTALYPDHASEWR